MLGVFWARFRYFKVKRSLSWVLCLFACFWLTVLFRLLEFIQSICVLVLFIPKQLIKQGATVGAFLVPLQPKGEAVTLRSSEVKLISRNVAIKRHPRGMSRKMHRVPLSPPNHSSSPCSEASDKAQLGPISSNAEGSATRLPDSWLASLLCRWIYTRYRCFSLVKPGFDLWSLLCFQGVFFFFVAWKHIATRLSQGPKMFALRNKGEECFFFWTLVWIIDE